MKFGKLKNINEINKINFNLPDDVISSNLLTSIKELKSKNVINNVKVYIGAPAWGIKEWEGKIYPKKTPATKYLKLYSELFNSIELNSTYYTLPNVEIIKSWRTQVSKTFRFSPKITRQISHSGVMTNKVLVNKFFSTIKYFDINLGIIFLQLSEYFSPSRIKELETFMTFIPKDIRLAIEFRHPAWFNRYTNIWDLLEINKITTVITDALGRPDALHMRLTNNSVMIRFVGNNLHPTDFKRIDKWIEKIKKWIEMGIKEIYFFVHEADEIACPEIADYFISKCIENNLGEFKRISFFNKIPN